MDRLARPASTTSLPPEPAIPSQSAPEPPAVLQRARPNGRVLAAWGPALVLLVALAARLAVLPASREDTMSPDAAHFLNVARCILRGQGFSNPAAWPAWLAPERLPAPETFKDPGLPYAIAALTPLTRDPFRAGQLLALLAGVLLPLAVLRLGHRVTGERSVGMLAAWLTAASPVLIAQSVRVMSESLFTVFIVLAMAAAAPGAHATAAAPGGVPRRAAGADLLAGALLGLAFLVRTQALLAVPAVLLLLAAGLPVRPATARALRATVALLVVAAPLLLRNLARFGAPLYSDAASFAVWPFVDPVDFTHRLTRPPAPWPFLIEHVPQVAAHTLGSLGRFARDLPRELVGHLVWTPALAAGLVLAITRRSRWGFAWAYAIPVVLMMCMVSWNIRYFASVAPIACLITAAGACWLAARVRHWPLAARVFGAAALTGLVALQTRAAWREVHGYRPPEMAAATAEAPFIAGHLAPGEAMMAVTTSYWSWFADRPSVHLPIAAEPEFSDVIRRYRVRWAALPTSRLAELAARYPNHRLPAGLVAHHADPQRDVTVFAVRDAEGRLPR